MIDIYAIAEQENVDVEKVFLVAQSIYGLTPTLDGYKDWLSGGPLPDYVQRFARQRERLERTETRGRR